MDKSALSSSRSRGQTWSSLSSHRFCEIAHGQLPCLNILKSFYSHERRFWPRASSLIEKETLPFWRSFIRVFSAAHETLAQRSQNSQKKWTRVDVSPEPLNPEPMNGYLPCFRFFEPFNVTTPSDSKGSVVARVLSPATLSLPFIRYCSSSDSCRP